MPPDELLAEAIEVERRSGTAERLFDIRRIIGGLFVLYGVILVVTGLFDTEAEIAKAEGVRINLWMGIGMLVLGLLFLLWHLLRPTQFGEVRAAAGRDDSENAS
ncbi:MAG: hypothetical protein GEV11_13900 [Streptosporangiales bacterium]|nr:hypothetical protein [Streptosporangiales bacterium]